MNNKKAIVIMGGGLVKDKQTGEWRTTNYIEGDNFGAMGDKLRVLAANYLFKEDSSQSIIASGGKGQLKDISDAPTVAEAIKNELIELGVPAGKIIKDEKSGNTWQQFVELKNIILRDGLEKINLISNGWHLPRIKAMIELDEVLSGLLQKNIIILKSAEEVLIANNPEKWSREIEDAYKSEAMKKRIALEEKGIREIKEGNYKLN
jgi:hypothetical protein